ncbi:MAG: hypothetical protein ACTS8S_03480 [Giesbergeria sp.]
MLPIEEFGLAVGLRLPWRASKCTVNEVSKTIHLWITNQGVATAEQRRGWFGAKMARASNKITSAEDKQWRHVDCMTYSCVIHTSDPLQPGDHELDWFGPPNNPFTKCLAKKIFQLLMEGVDMQVICEVLCIPFAELWKFKYDLDNGLLNFEYTPSMRRRARVQQDSLPSVATQAAAPEVKAAETTVQVPDVSDPVWEHLITGKLNIDIKTLSLQLLLTKLRQQVTQLQSKDVKIMKLRELHRYVERHQRVLRHELLQLKPL